ncbi:MAG: hypothetical protein WB709_12465 [Solirubrobacteraceae bacterium]
MGKAIFGVAHVTGDGARRWCLWRVVAVVIEDDDSVVVAALRLVLRRPKTDMKVARYERL